MAFGNRAVRSSFNRLAIADALEKNHQGRIAGDSAYDASKSGGAFFVVFQNQDLSAHFLFRGVAAHKSA